MNGFIELTLTYDNSKVAIAIDKIIAVMEDKEKTFVQTGRDNKHPRGIAVKESYAEVVEKIREATKFD